ncbi:Fic family protein [Candidatus Pacearchaeota archaeon]|nr:Fic family protein [Candidatus Pacearchaeota archaeon]
MVYHEIRNIKGNKKNYLIYNRREKNKWSKKSKFIGVGNISKSKVSELKEKFEEELITEKKYLFLTKEQIKEIEKNKKVFNEKIKKLNQEEFERLENSFFTELTYNSNAIEGNSLSLEETSLVVNENLSPEGKTLREIYEAKNHIKALEFIKNYKGDFSENFILKLHLIILKEISERFAGRYRETQVKIFGSNVRFPTSEKVPQLIKNLVYWYKKNKTKYHSLELATLVSLKFVTIHPFIDGNGRVSRLIMNFLLNKKDYPWINIYKKQRQQYLKAVRKSNDEDYSLIFPFLIKTLKDNLESFGFTD